MAPTRDSAARGTTGSSACYLTATETIHTGANLCPPKIGTYSEPAKYKARLMRLNRELRGPKDTKGYGPVNVDLLGNLQVDARDAAIGDVMLGIKALSDELGYGVVVTGVKTDDIRMLRGAGFESEISLAAVADGLTGVREKTAGDHGIRSRPWNHHELPAARLPAGAVQSCQDGR